MLVCTYEYGIYLKGFACASKWLKCCALFTIVS